MNTRPLSPKESENIACLNRAGKSSALLFLTATGLRKSILDATEPLRRLLCTEGIHDYVTQGQGKVSKRLLPACILAESGISPVIASLYRPTTKHGDPRIWFSRMNQYATPDDVCAVFIHEGTIHVLNLTQTPLAAIVAYAPLSPLGRFFIALQEQASVVAEELLGKLRQLACEGPLKAICEGSTAIGRSIENALGIAINSSRAPDFKGIELKSGRAAISGRGNRATLFACVPDWHLSRCKSSKQILDEFGYARNQGNAFKLYCTISSRRPNSQGLVFEFTEAERWLCEVHRDTVTKDVAIWRLERLEEYLAAKHRQTFWINARQLWQSGHEYFDLLSVIHTRNPNIPQLERMLREGQITMDHLIKRVGDHSAREKGPLFKIDRPRIPELFLGAPQFYALK